jgi:hypothetical protein
MMDGLLDLLERPGGIERFYLDGQVAMIDDYVEARPEAVGRIRRLLSDGRLAAGPWYVLMDEFCVSAETIVRNLQLGMERAARLGAAGPAVGYLPDMFGHVGQMPQILAQAGISQAVVWRGVPTGVTSTGFWWVAPDGSRVRAEYLPVGYAAGAFLPKEAPSLVRRMAAYEREIERFTGPDGSILLMNGGDHQAPQAWLARLLDEANRIQDRFRFHQTGLAEFLEKQPLERLSEWHGELRSGARAPILMGVLSNRVDVKQAAAAAEAALERWAEPLAALWLPPDMWPAGLFDRAWLEMIRNSAHDSVCACSADPVVRSVLQRYDSAGAIADEVAGSARSIAGVATAAAGPMVVNSLPDARSGVVEVVLAGTSVPAGGQQLDVRPAASEERHGRGRDLATILGQLARDGWLDPNGRGSGARLSGPSSGPLSGPDSDAGGLVLTIESDPSRTPDPAMAAVMAEAWARAGAGRDEPLTVRVERAAWQRVALWMEDVPGWGWVVWRPESGVSAGFSSVEVGAGGGAVRVANGLVSVEVDRSTGTFSLDGVPGQNLLVEEADEGDTYNFSPPPGDRPAVSVPVQADVEIVESGPVRAVVRVTRRYRWDTETTVVSDVAVTAGDPAVRITTCFDHTGRDHRIRAVFPIGAAALSTEAECAFGTATRSGAEGGPHEPALATFPSRRFVRAGEVTVTHRGLLEHELVDGGRGLAVTLLRATGILSRPAPAARPNVAGPPLHLRDAQMPGPQRFEYAVVRDCPDPWTLADRVWTPLGVLVAGGHGHLPERGSRLQIRTGGAKVSSLRRRDGAIEVRLFNPTEQPVTVSLPGHAGTLVDLRGEPVGTWEGSFDLVARAFTTARLGALSLD